MPDDFLNKPSLSDESTIIDPQARIASLVNHTPPGGMASLDGKASADPPTIIEDDAYSLARKHPASHPLQRAHPVRRPAVPIGPRPKPARTSGPARMMLLVAVPLIAAVIGMYLWMRNRPQPTAAPVVAVRTPAAVAASPDLAPATKPGEPILVGPIEYVVLGSKAAKRLAVQPSPTSTAGAFVGIDLWADNKSTAPVLLDVLSMKLVSQDGKRYNPAAGLDERHGAIPTSFGGPGVNQGYLIFDAPAGQNYELQLTNSATKETRSIALGNVGDPVEELIPLGKRATAVSEQVTTAPIQIGSSATARPTQLPTVATSSISTVPAASPLPQLYPTAPPSPRTSDADYRD